MKNLLRRHGTNGMSISIASNITSLKIQTQIGRTNDKLSKTFERLSSGYRINSSSDDPAGLALADSLRSSSKVAAVAIRNVNDAISATSTGDSAIDSISSVLTRLSELANQSASSTYSTAQRSAMQSEFDSLGSEVERISRTTQFNGISLLSNSGSLTIQVGIDGTSNSQIVVQTASTTLSSLGIGSVAGALTYSISGATVNAAVTASQAALTAITSAQDVLTTARARFGAAESRLSYAVDYITVARENYSAAEGRIRDVDVAQEVADLVRLQTLQAAQVAVLAQANQTPAQVLKLLS